jgi:DNA modification methylase
MKSLPEPLYMTQQGAAYVGDACELLLGLPDESIDLVFTSPPFALQRQKEYGNVAQDRYVDWLLSFAREVKRVLRSTGSFVLDLGGAYCQNRPVRSLHNYRFIIRMCDELGWNLAEEFFWFNPARLPSPIEWVNRRKIRAKDAVNTIWWFSRTDFPKADITKVLAPYSESMKRLLQNPDSYYSPGKRPSGHAISHRFAGDRGGAIPPNLLQFPNTESNSSYLRACQMVGAGGHPSRFPKKLPEFFIRFLTDEGDTVLDLFAGSNTTGAVAETLGRRWVAFEIEQSYLAGSAFRFLDVSDEATVRAVYHQLMDKGARGLRLPPGIMQGCLFENDGRKNSGGFQRGDGERFGGEF